MSTVGQTPLNLNPGKTVGASPERRKAMLRQAADEMVGITFFGQMLKMARNARIKGEFGHGGRGEEVFGGQLDQELARLAGQGMKNSLSEAIYKRLVENV
jgi:hypothetical protein